MSDPARALCTRPQSRPAGSLTPHVSVGDVLGRACRVRGKCCPRIRTDVSAKFPPGTNSKNSFASAAVPAGVAVQLSRSDRVLVCGRSGSRLFGSAWARQGSASPLRALDPPGALPMLCNYRSDGHERGSIPGWLTSLTSLGGAPLQFPTSLRARAAASRRFAPPLACGRRRLLPDFFQRRSRGPL